MDKLLEFLESHEITVVAAVKYVVPILVSIVGLFISYLATVKKIRAEIRQAVNDDRKEIYINTYNMLDKVVVDNKKVFEKDFYEELLKFKPKIYFIGSSKVIRHYKKFGDFVIYTRDKYFDFESKNNIYKYYTDENGCDYPEFNDMDEEIYKQKLHAYKEENTPSRKVLKRKIKRIVKYMRKDIGVK